ncbi:MAG TPA: CRTAC1 family protein [Thermoanaerobaculia bacterium]|nr:CRTAC1 family protein [Thermoanaerobaculia bacterium]
MVRDVRGRASKARTRTRRLLGVLALLLALGSPVFADGGVTFNDIAENGGAGIGYLRAPSPSRLAARSAIEAMGVLPFATWRDTRAFQFPMKAGGAPGIALIDFDNDGDNDIYVTNGPGAANSLYSNQLKETGSLSFVDVAAAAGVTATSQDSQGVCYGDIDNDGDRDLYVLGSGEPNRLFENQLSDAGSAVFTDVTAAANAGGAGRHGVACSMGDINGDGLLDIVIANSYDDWLHQRPTFLNETYVGFEHNTLLVNQGGSFTDETAARGLETIIGLPAATLTWAIAMVDYDRDGDVDIFFADSQGPPPTLKADERGYNRLYENDGNGVFTDVTFDKQLDKHGSWMGLSFGDFNCDGHIDFHSTNLGDQMGGLGLAVTRHFLGSASGVFSDPGIGGLVASSFGWGTVTTDYDNDGDTDIAYNGGMDIMTVIAVDNPGNVLQNQGCTAQFKYDVGVRTREHRHHTVEGVAVGDLNNDGFDDLVTVSGGRWVANANFLPWIGILAPPRGSAIDPLMRFQGVWIGSVPAGGQLYQGLTRLPGDMTVEINSGGNGNGSVAISLTGASGVLANGEAPRTPFGAVLSFTPKNGKTSLRPLVGGASYASQDTESITFGLGKANKGTVDILWPGGTRNRLYDVHRGERLNLPEIPCSFDADWASYQAYHSCVKTALDGLRNAGVVSTALHGRLLSSAIKAYNESN